MQIYPIRNEQDHAKALARIEKLMDAELTAAQGDELDALVTLVAAYEEKYQQINVPTPVAAIEFWMDQQKLTRKDLEPILGSRARVSEILNGKRSLTLRMIRKLHVELGIPLELLIEEGDGRSARTGGRSTSNSSRAIASRRRGIPAKKLQRHIGERLLHAG